MEAPLLGREVGAAAERHLAAEMARLQAEVQHASAEIRQRQAAADTLRRLLEAGGAEGAEGATRRAVPSDPGIKWTRKWSVMSVCICACPDSAKKMIIKATMPAREKQLVLNKNLAFR